MSGPRWAAGRLAPVLGLVLVLVLGLLAGRTAQARSVTSGNGGGNEGPDSVCTLVPDPVTGELRSVCTGGRLTWSCEAFQAPGSFDCLDVHRSPDSLANVQQAHQALRDSAQGNPGLPDWSAGPARPGFGVTDSALGAGQASAGAWFDATYDAGTRRLALHFSSTLEGGFMLGVGGDWMAYFAFDVLKPQAAGSTLAMTLPVFSPLSLDDVSVLAQPNHVSIYTAQPWPVPEPGRGGLAAVGLAGLALLMRRRRSPAR